jgi:hypothetical protein
VTLATALTAAGMPANQALPAVLVYRLISFWLVLATGWAVLARLTRYTGPPTPEDPAKGTPDDGPDEGPHEGPG